LPITPEKLLRYLEETGTAGGDSEDEEPPRRLKEVAAGRGLLRRVASLIVSVTK
jgi:hypothetical protein